MKPVIIPRAEHGISRKFLSPNAVRVLYRLRDQGFTAYLVGGSVRDLLLGREPKDFDIATDATPGQIKRLFRNCRLVGRRFRLAHLHFRDEIIEVATFRSAAMDADSEQAEAAGPEGAPRLLKSEEGMLLRDNVFGTPEEDAVRRDFTVNALAYDVADFSVIDHVGGMADLRRGMIRTIGEPLVRFTEDPVRMLRAVRFAAMLGFVMEEETCAAILGLRDTIKRAAPARLYEEILKLFLLGEGEKAYQLLRRTGLFAALFPRFDAWLTEESDGFPHAGPGRALAWVDARIGAGEKVSPQLLLALIFGQYIDEKGEAFRKGGAPPAEALNRGVAELLAEISPTVQVPHRLALAMRDILASQYRFRKTPGRHPHSFIGRPGFGDALDYLRFACAATGEMELCTWWERFMREHPQAPAEAGAEIPKTSHGGRRGRRRRRRGRKGAEKADT